MSYTSELLSELQKIEEERKKKKKEKYGSNDIATLLDDDDIAPVKSTVSFSPKVESAYPYANQAGSMVRDWYGVSMEDVQKEKEEDDDSLQFFQKGAFEDGYQFGDVTKAILGTTGDTAVGLGKGALKLVEGAVDLLDNGTAYVADWLGFDESAEQFRTIADRNAVDDAFKGVDDYLDQYSVLGHTLDSGAEGVGQALALGGLGKIASGALGLGKAGVSLLTNGTLFASSMGSAIGESRQEGGTELQSLKHGLNSGAVETISEMLYGGVGKCFKALGLGKGLTDFDDVVAKAVSSKIKHQVTKNVVEFGVKSGFEGLEELISGIGQAISKHNTYENGEPIKNVDDLMAILADENLLEQFVVGSLTSGITQSGIVPGTESGSLREANRTGRDFITGYSKNEQAVLDKEIENRIAEKEKNGNKLTAKEKSKIAEQVEKDLERGYISTDTIESVLGGDSYKGYQSMLEQESSLKKEIEALENTPESQFTIKQRERLTEARKQLAEIDTKTAKSKLFSDVEKLTAKDYKLRESYNELVRANQDFVADFDKYKGTKHEDSARKTLENAIKAGASNSNRVHDIVDLAAHLSAESGLVYDFKSTDDITNDFIEQQTKKIAQYEALENPTAEQSETLAKLKEQLEKVKSGAIKVEGNITGNDIVLNYKNERPLQVIVGHETTHSMEQAKAYEALRDAVFTYAKSKGVDVDAKIADLKLRYEGIENASAESELVSDLVGEYLFTDSDFVMNLTTADRNLAQRVYDKIKHLYKMATAGSKEARELERVKYAFENAFREAEQNRAEAQEAQDEQAVAEEFSDANTQYSIREKAPPKNTIVGYKVFIVKDGKLYPPMVANPEGEGTPVGVWLDADVGGLSYDESGNVQLNNRGRFKVKAGGKGTQGGGGELAFRPGWHLGEYPDASQFGRENAEKLVPNKDGKMVHPKELFPYNFVWAKCEVAADNDYQLDAMSFGVNENGNFERTQAGLPYIPDDGYYKYRTNADPNTAPWIISGSIKVVEILDDEQVAKICAEHGVTPQQRQAYATKTKESWPDTKTIRSELNEAGVEIPKGAKQADLRKLYSETFLNGEIPTQVSGYSAEARPGGKIDLPMFGLNGGQVTPTSEDVLAQIRQTEGTAATRKAETAELLKTLPGYAKRKINFADANIIKEFSMNNQSVDEYRAKAEETGHGYLVDEKIYSGDVAPTKYSLTNGIDNKQDLAYNGIRGESYARTDEFRNLQAASQRMSDEELQGYHRGDRTLDENVRGRLSRVLTKQVEAVCGSNSNDSRLLRLGTENNTYNIYENVNGELFHDAFEVSRKYLKNGELVDLHTVETTDDGIGYNDCYNYLSEDGLSGFSITPDGDLISVFNSSGKKGFLRAISDIVTAKAKTLDCYASPNQNLMAMYEKVFGFKTASIMDYNMEYDHDDIAKNHDMPKVAFMVNTDSDVELREFTEDQYDEAVEYRNSFMDQAASDEAASFVPGTDDIAPTKYSLTDSIGNKLSAEQQEFFKDSKVRDYNGNLLVVYHGTPNGRTTVFDKSKTSKDNNMGQGIYFSTSKGDATEYMGKSRNRKLYTAYVNIKNPFVVSQNERISVADAKNLLLLCDDRLIASDVYHEVKINAKDGYITTAQFANTNISTQMTEMLEKSGRYDGIIDETVSEKFGLEEGVKHIIVLNPEQIKSVDNKTPTSDKDIRYSLSDSNGNQLSPAVQNRFAKSKVVDENGSLKVVYHGTATGEFTIFDKAKGSVEGDFGSGFYFTDNAHDVERNYEGGGPDFDNKIDRRAEQIEAEEDISYAAARKRAIKELYVGSHKFEVYLNIENPAVVGKTTLLDYESFAEEYDRNDYDSDEDYESDVEYLISDKIDEIIWEVEKNVDVYSTDGLAEVLWNAVNEGGIDVEQLKANINELYLEDSNGNMVGNEVTRQIIESLGYDGIIDPTVSGKWNMEMEAGTTHYIVFKPNQIKNVSNQNPTDNPDINLSLFNKDEDIAPMGDFYYYGNDFGRDVSSAETAPVTAKTEQNVPKTKNVPPVTAEAPVAENIAPVNEATKRSEVESVVGNKDGFMSKRATELYEEITSLKKGVRASQKLGYLLDHGYDWRSIKTALLNIRDNPNQVVNPNSAAESVAREMLGREYDSMVEDFMNADGVTGNIYAKMQGLRTELENNQRLRAEASADFDSEIARLQAVYDGKKNQNTRVANDILRRIERIKRLKSQVDADYGKRIEKTEARLEKMSKPEYKTAMQRKQKQSEYTSLMENLVGNTATWVDKKLGLSYKVNTLRRNLRDIVRDANGNQDIAKADAIYDELQGKYNHNEAELKRESARIKEVFQKLKLNHAESSYAHMLGEFRHNPSSKLTEEDVKDYYNKHKRKIDTAKVDKAIEESRKVFDELYDRLNERLREQGMKEIPYRQGYFPHFENPKQTWLHKFFNWKPVDSEIPTDIAGITEQFNPERSWQSFNKQRKGDTTDYNLTQALDGYIHGALDWIYHIEDLQKRRALENHIRYTHSEEGVKKRIDKIRNDETYDADEMQAHIDAVFAEAKNPLNNFVTDLRAGTNTLANKKSSMDRQAEEVSNRKIYSVMTNLNNRINANMVVGSFSSALTNFIPITQSWMEVSPVYSLKGMRDTIKSTIRDDGVVSKSDFLTNRLMNEEKLYQTGWDKVSDKVGFMMEAIDSFTSQTVWRSKYLQNISEGMSETEAIKNADQFAENVIAGRSRGNQPTIFDAKNPITKIFTAFQLEVANQYGYMFKDAPQDSKNKARLIKGYATAFLGAYAYNALYSSLVGRDAAFDPISILEDLFKDLFGDDEEEPEEALLNLADNVLEEVPFVGSLLGGGRIPMSSAIPYGGDFKSLVTGVANSEASTKEWLKPIYYLALPVAGGQIKKINESFGMFSDDHPVSGSYTEKGYLRFPVEDTLGNRVQAAMFGQYASKNARDYFDNGRSPLKEKQIQEYIDVDIPIRDYWEYREGLAKQKTVDDKFDYIADLDLPVSKKNILINNIVDRKEDVDMTGYEDFSSYDEFDFATKNPGKYAVSQVVGDYSAYSKYYDDINDLTADKDENGKSINGSRKEKVFSYIDSLPLDYGQKCILFKSQYKADDSVNMDIIEYLDSREDIDYDEMVTILTELGFTVDGNNVYWD